MSMTNIAMTNAAIDCRRASHSDRRRSHLRATLISFFKQRRKHVRREAEVVNDLLADLRQSYSYTMLFAILAFLAVDAALSLALLTSMGGTDATFIELMSQPGIQNYFLLKSVIASVCIFFAAVYQSVPSLSRISVNKVLTMMFVGYLFLIGIEVSLLI